MRSELTPHLPSPSSDPDAGQAVALSGRVRRVLAPNPSPMTGRGTNTYVIGASPPYTVIDPGPADDRHLRAILAAAPDIGAIVVTHTHRDHSPGAAGLAAATGAVVLGFGPMLRPSIEGHDDSFRADRLLVDGDVVEGADHRLVALHTPGHASNHLCYLLEGDGGRVLFTGDHIMEGSTVVIAPLDGDMDDYLAQLRRIQALGVDRLLPGHGRPIDDPAGYIEGYLDHRAARTATLLAALAAAGPAGATCTRLVEQAYVDVDPSLHPVAVYSAWATLRAAPTAASDHPDAVDGTWRIKAPTHEGGDPPCWQHHVCDTCGGYVEDGQRHRCPPEEPALSMDPSMPPAPRRGPSANA